MPTPLSQDEINEYIRLKGFDPAEADLDMFTGEVKPRQKAQPALSTPEASAPTKKETFWRSTALSVLPSAASLPVGAAVGMKAAAAAAPLATVPFVGPAIPVVAGLSAGLLAGGLASAGASQVQQKVLEQSEGGQKFLERAALARETNPITSAVGDVAGSLPLMRVNPKMLGDAAKALTTERAAGAGLLNKLANPAVQEIGISGALGGGMSAYEDIQEGKDVNVGKALVNTVLQGLVSDIRPGVASRIPGLRGTSYTGLPGAEPAAEGFIPNRVATPVEPSPADVAAIANERAGLEIKLKGVEDSLKSVVDEAKREQIQREAKIALAELELKNKELAAREQALREKVTFEASPENVEWAKQMAIAKGADEFVAEPTGVLDATSGKTYGALSVSPEGKRSIRASTTAAEESAKGEISTTLPEGLIRDQEGTAIGPRASTLVHENLHNDFLNMIQSDRAAQRKMGTQILDAVDKSPEFAEWKSKQTAENLSRMPDPREEFFAIEASKQFLRDPENTGRTWRGERAALKNLQTGKGGLQDAVQIGLMKFRYDRGLNANLTNVAKAAGAKASLASDVRSEIERREKNPEMEQMEFRKTAQEGSPLSKYLRDTEELPPNTFLPKKGQMEMRLSQPAREAKLGPSESLFFTTEDSPLKKKFFEKYPLLKEINPNGWPKKYLSELYGVDRRRINDFEKAREQTTGKPVDWKEVIDSNLYDPNRYPKMERVAGKSQAVRDEEGELVMRDRPTKEVVSEFTPGVARVIKQGVDRAVEPLPTAKAGVRFAMLRALENPQNSRYGGDKDYRQMLLSRVQRNIAERGLDVEGKNSPDKNLFMTAAREAQRLMRADFMELRRKKEAAKREAGVMEEVVPKQDVNVEDIKKQLQENYRKFDSDQIDDDTYETTLTSLETKLKDAGLSRDEILDIVSDAETPAETVKPSVTKVTPNPEAVRRRNIEPDGRIYQRGELVIPTVEIANSFKPKIADYDRKIAILEGLKKANPNAAIAEIRSLGYKNDRVIEADSGVTSWDEAIRAVKDRKADTTQYIKDIEEAAKLFKTETSAAPAKKTNTVAQTRETVKEFLDKGIIDKDEAAQLNRELAGMKDSDTVNLPELIADIRRGGADEVQYQPDEDRYSLPSERVTLTDEKDIFVTDVQKQFESGRPYGLQTSKDGKFASSDILAKLRNTPKVEQELLGKGFTDWLTVRSRVSPEEVKEWLDKNGPKVEVHNYGMEGKVSEAKREYDKMTHEWFDTILTDEQTHQLNYASDMLDPEAWLRREGWKQADIDKAVEYLSLEAQAQSEPPDTSPRATSYYDTVSAFPTNEPMPDWTTSKEGKNVQRVDVVLPSTLTKNAREEIGFSTKAGREQIPLWQPDNLHENLPNTLGWAMIQYKTGARGERIAVIAEAQSRWGQTIRENNKKPARSNNPDINELDRRARERVDHPLLRDYNRLILKSAIDQARKEGATHVMISDAETAMMTEGHDAQPLTIVKLTEKNLARAKEIVSYGEENNIGYGDAQKLLNGKQLEYEAGGQQAKQLGYDTVQEAPQEPGMRFNYDASYVIADKDGQQISDKRFATADEAARYAESQLRMKPASKYPKDWKGPRDEADYKILRGDLPSIMTEITGDEGTRVSLGEHKNAFDETMNRAARGDLAFRIEDTAVYDPEESTKVQAKRLMEKNGLDYAEPYVLKNGRRYFVQYADYDTMLSLVSYPERAPRENLIFRNADGTPKTDVSGTMFDISVPASRREAGEKFTFGGRRFSTPGERETHYLELAKSPEKNLEELQQMVDEAAKKENKVKRYFLEYSPEYIEHRKKASYNPNDEKRIDFMSRIGFNSAIDAYNHSMSDGLTEGIIEETISKRRETAENILSALKYAPDSPEKTKILSEYTKRKSKDEEMGKKYTTRGPVYSAADDYLSGILNSLGPDNIGLLSKALLDLPYDSKRLFGDKDYIKKINDLRIGLEAVEPKQHIVAVPAYVNNKEAKSGMFPSSIPYYDSMTNALLERARNKGLTRLDFIPSDEFKRAQNIARLSASMEPDIGSQLIVLTEKMKEGKSAEWLESLKKSNDLKAEELLDDPTVLDFGDSLQPFFNASLYINPPNKFSADPVIYDDAGNVIPLSQRFQQHSEGSRFSSPASRETLSIGATEEDRMKKGWIEAFAPQFDKVPDKQVSEAMKNMDTQRSMYLGAWHYAPIKEFQSKFKHMPEDRLNVIYDRVLETYRKGKKDLITEGLSSQEIKAANFLNENVYRAVRGKQKEIGMKVETREGLRREAKLSPWYVPEMLNDKALQAFTKGDQSATAQRYIDMWADHVVDQSAGTVTKKEALEEIRNYVAAIGEGGRRGTEFGALRKAAGYGLPKELRERNLLRVTQRYSRRAAQDVARFQHLELPEYVRNKLALPDPDTGVVHTQDSILHIEDVRQAMKFVNNSFEIYHNPRVASFARLVTNGILGPLTGIRDFMSIPVNALPYVKATDIGTIFTSLLDARRDWQKSLKTGARTGMNQLDAVDTIPNLDKTTYAFNVASEMLRKYQGRDAIEQVNRVWTYSIGKNLAERAVLEKNKAFLEKFGRLAKDEATGKYNTDIMAKNFVDRVQGTYGGAGLPSSSVDGMAAPWFALARWSLEKSNVIWQDVIQPAYRKNNPQYGPLLRYALGAYLTGEAIDLLVEEINSGKKSNIPTYAELQAADADPESYVAKLVNVMQLGSFAGMAGDVAKMAMDAYRGEKPQGFSVPAATLISQGIGDTVVNFSRAVRDGTDPLDAAGILILELMKNQVQTARLVLNAADNEDVDRKNALRDLRLYKQMRGEILPSDFQRANPAMRPEEREFKRAKTEEEAGASLAGIITNLQEEFKNDPRGLRKALDRLKKNSYQTFPNLELDPAGATEYYQYLIQSLGPVEAKKRLDDYIKQTSLNKAKTAAIP